MRKLTNINIDDKTTPSISESMGEFRDPPVSRAVPQGGVDVLSTVYGRDIGETEARVPDRGTQTHPLCDGGLQPRGLGGESLH